MPENSIVSALIQSFAPANKEQWKRAASREINDQNPLEKLSWKNNDGIEFFPYYDREDLIRSAPAHFRLQPAKNSLSGARDWQCAPFVSAGDAQAANKIALEHLLNGADSIFFDTRSRSDVSFDDLLHNIEWPYCSLYFSIEQEHSEKVRKYITNNTLPPDQLAGGFFWETCPKKSTIDFFLNETKNFHPLGLRVAPDSPAREISNALVQGVRLVEEIADSGKDQILAFNGIAFSVSTGANFMETIAKLKTLRALWFQIAQAYGIIDYSPDDLLIHARTEPWPGESYQPHGNMIFTTLAAMASVIGGCNALTLAVSDEDNVTMSRIARNISSILREESHLNKVSDPLSGSYTLEAITDQIAQTAWALFQSNIKR